MSSSALVIVSSPSQLLFAIEGLEHLRVEQADLVILLHRDHPGADQHGSYAALLALRPFRHVTTMPLAQTYPENARQAARFLLRARPHRYLVTALLGHLAVRTVVRARARSHGADDLITDDGSWTIELADALGTGTPSARAGANVLRELPRALRLFTMYADDVRLRPADTLIANRFSWTRRQRAPGADPQRAIVLGSDYVGAGYLTRERYVDGLVRLAEQLERPALYLPHRRERPDLRDEVLRRTGFELGARLYPVELEIGMYADPATTTVASVPSTAIRGIRQAGGTELDILLATFPPDEVAAPLRHSYALIAESCAADATRSVTI